MSSTTDLLDELEVKIHDLEDEREELADRVRTLNYLAASDAASDPTDDDRMPRVISADELREGQAIAWKVSGNSSLWATTVIEESDITPVNIFTGRTIILLEDAPEPEPVTAEDIRASEPGSTWEDRAGDAWEWDGVGLVLHSDNPGGFVSGYQVPVESVAGSNGPLARSFTPSRGDYSPRAPQVGDEVTTEEELEALPALSVVLDKDGDAFRKSRGPGEWFTAGDSEPWDFEEMVPPFKVVHVGGEGA